MSWNELLRASYRVAVIFIIACCGQQAAAQFEVTFNGDFERGDLVGWEDFTVPIDGQTFEVIDESPFSGNFHGKLDNQKLASGAVIKQANVGIGLVEPGQVADISFWARAEWGVGGVFFAQFFSEQDGGGVSKEDTYTLFSPNPADSPADWTFFNFTTGLGPDVAEGVTLQFVSATGGAAGSFATLEIDDVSVVISDGLPGDFNADAQVNLADYTLWRDNLGGDSDVLNNNGTGAPTVVVADYDLWKSNFGLGGSSSSLLTVSTGVPEPSTAWLLLLAAVSSLFKCGRTLRRVHCFVGE